VAGAKLAACWLLRLHLDSDDESIICFRNPLNFLHTIRGHIPEDFFFYLGQLIASSRILLEKLTVAQLLKIVDTFDETTSSTTAVTRVRK
jgi:hypothetical protein